eukprot:TRINITY_DN13706_c0_g2_i1.p1 TRINITY_DN13706_c0_g2~~TRINITY_DN13706_c0_g2_i1.p1  ORF type:complete len:334 (+),score=37.57 TRINITY_DN13706_c0_g2_i1:65-1003(+)
MEGLEQICLDVGYSQTIADLKKRLGHEWGIGDMLVFSELDETAVRTVGEAPWVGGDLISVKLSERGQAVADVRGRWGLAYPTSGTEISRVFLSGNRDLLKAIYVAHGRALPNKKPIEFCITHGCNSMVTTLIELGLEVTRDIFELAVNMESSSAVELIRKIPKGVVGPFEKRHLEVLREALAIGWEVPRSVDLKFHSHAMEKAAALIASGRCVKDTEIILHHSSIHRIAPLTEAFRSAGPPPGLALDLQSNDLQSVTEEDWAAFFAALSQCTAPGMSIDIRYNHLDGHPPYETQVRKFRSGRMPPTFMLFAS